MLPLPNPVLNGVTLTHEELRGLHAEMRRLVHAQTAARALDGPRPLSLARGEDYSIEVVKRASDGSLLARITISMPWAGAPYTRSVRLQRRVRLNRELTDRVDRVLGCP